jgi:ATP-dependent Clp protease ATP-binding subunit ClpA
MAAAAIGFGGRSNADKGGKAIERLFSPEFRNRLDAIIAFGALSPPIIERIVDKFILELDAQLNEKRVFIQLTPAARGYLAEKGYDPTFGARPMARLIQIEIKRVLADEILFGRLRDGGKVDIDVADGALTFAYVPAEPTAAPTSTEEPDEIEEADVISGGDSDPVER